MKVAFERRSFRSEFGRIVSLLTKRYGYARLESIEDAVQSAVVAALEHWPENQPPANPSAWLYRVAKNRLIDGWRAAGRQAELLGQILPESDPCASDEPPRFDGEFEDDLVVMLFHVCEEGIPEESRLVFALRSLLGFQVEEIARLLFISEANVYKRLSRARMRLRESAPELGQIPVGLVSGRLPSVCRVVYLLFTEGHFSTRPGEGLRRELCDEASHLSEILARNPSTANPETFALAALIHLHAARLASRQDLLGGLLLLHEQDRALWDRRRIELGLEWLARSARGTLFSRYHAEAAVAAEHSLAVSFDQTRWDRIVENYELLERLAPSPIHALNRALALAEWKGPQSGLDALEDQSPPSWLVGSYQWSAVKADLLGRTGRNDEAEVHARIALAIAPSEEVRALLRRRFDRVLAV